MTISLIVAVSQNQVIGKNNTLPWHLPADMKYFKDTTMEHCIITGRKNYESIPSRFRPLSGRTNIVVTRQKGFMESGCIVVHSIEEALLEAMKKNESEVFIIGGSEIFNQTLNITDRIYYTKVHHSFDGDVFFPKLDEKAWSVMSQKDFPADEKNKYPYSFCVFEKNNR